MAYFELGLYLTYNTIQVQVQGISGFHIQLQKPFLDLAPKYFFIFSSAKIILYFFGDTW